MIPLWLTIIAWIAALLSVATGFAGYLVADTMFETVDLSNTEAWFLAKTWAARNMAIGLFIAYAAWKRTQALLSMAFLLYLLVNVQDALIGFMRPEVGPEVGPMALVFALLSLFALWQTNRIKEGKSGM